MRELELGYYLEVVGGDLVQEGHGKDDGNGEDDSATTPTIESENNKPDPPFCRARGPF